MTGLQRRTVTLERSEREEACIWRCRFLRSGGAGGAERAQIIAQIEEKEKVHT